MAATSTLIAVGIGASLLGTAVQYVGQRQAQKAARRQAAEAAAARQRAEELQNRREAIQAARQRRRAAVEARRLRGAAVNVAAQRGFGGAIGAQGSTLAGVQGSIQSQLNYNNAFINRTTELNAQIRSAFGEARDIASRPITAGSGLMAFGSFLSTAGAFTAKYSGRINNMLSSTSSTIDPYEYTRYAEPQE